MNKKAIAISTAALAVSAALIGGNMCLKSQYISQTEKAIDNFNATKQSSMSEFNVDKVSITRDVVSNSPFTLTIDENIIVKLEGGGESETITLVNDVKLIPFSHVDINTKLKRDSLVGEIAKNFSFYESVTSKYRISGDKSLAVNVNIKDIKTTEDGRIILDGGRIEIGELNSTFVMGFKEPSEHNFIAKNSNNVDVINTSIEQVKLYAPDQNESITLSADEISFTSNIKNTAHPRASDKTDVVSSEFSVNNSVVGISEYDGETYDIEFGDINLRSEYVLDSMENTFDTSFSLSIDKLKVPEWTDPELGLTPGSTFKNDFVFKLSGLNLKSIQDFVEVNKRVVSNDSLETDGDLSKKSFENIVNNGAFISASNKLHRLSDDVSILDVRATSELVKNDFNGDENQMMGLMPFVTSAVIGSTDLGVVQKIKGHYIREGIKDLKDQGLIVVKDGRIHFNVNFKNGQLLSFGKPIM